MDPAFKKALQISGGAHVLLVVAMLVNFSFFDDNEVIVVPLYSASNAPLMASVVENPQLKEAKKATKKKVTKKVPKKVVKKVAKKKVVKKATSKKASPKKTGKKKVTKRKK